MTGPLGAEADRSFHWLTLRFRDPALEAAFIAETNRRAVGPLRVIIAAIILVVAIPAFVELYGFYEEGWGGFDLWLQTLVYRAGNIALLLAALWLTTKPWAVRRGQPIVAAFLIVLYVLFMLGADLTGPWIERLAALFNYAAALGLVALGLLFRYAAPLVLPMAVGFAPVVARWMENPFAPLFVTFATVLTMSWVAYAAERSRREAWAAAQALDAEKRLSERLLLNVLPPGIAARMRAGETLIADSHDEATVVFADIANFTPLSATMPPEALVEILDEIFAGFDRIAAARDLEKIKTIGDAYMMAAGLPLGRSPDPAHALDAALEMRSFLAGVAEARGAGIAMRAGVHVGPVVAGVIGRAKFVYDLWGDSVNVASRMESTAPVGAIQVTQAVRDRLAGAFRFTERGEIEVKGKGRMRTWLLEGRA